MPHGFSEDGIKRVIAAVKQIESGDGGTGAGRSRSTSRPPAFVKVTSSAPGAGAYFGKMIIPSTSAITSSTAVTVAAYGSEGVDVLIWNEAEVGKSTHDLEAGAVCHGEVFRFLADGTPVVSVWALPVDDCPEGA